MAAKIPATGLLSAEPSPPRIHVTAPRHRKYFVLRKEDNEETERKRARERKKEKRPSTSRGRKERKERGGGGGRNKEFEHILKMREAKE